MTVIVFNPCNAAWDAVAATGRFQFKDGAGTGIVVAMLRDSEFPLNYLLRNEPNPMTWVAPT